MHATGTASNYIDLLDEIHAFLTAKGSAFGLAYAGAGNGVMGGLSGGPNAVAETWTVTATSATNFTVVGSVTGSVGPATAGTPFDVDQVEFTITAGATAFEAGDVFTFSTAPAWTSRRRALGCRVTATQVNTGQFAAQNLVDGKTSDTAAQIWSVDSPVTNPQDIEFEFFEAETIARYELAGFNPSGGEPTGWTFGCWNGSAWVTLDTRTGVAAFSSNEVKAFDVASPVSAALYRLHLTAWPYTTLRLGAVRLLRSDGVDAAYGQLILEAPGNDGDQAIFVGLHPFERQDADYFDLEVVGFDGFTAGVGFRAQPGMYGRRYLPLWDQPIPYWLIADGARAIVIAKVNNQYEAAYLGFCDSYFTPGQWPYPMVLGAALVFGPTLPIWSSTDFRWSNSTNRHRAFTHSDPAGDSTPTALSTQLCVRVTTGSYLPLFMANNDSPLTGGAGDGLIWPYSSQMTALDPNPDGSWALFPVMLATATPNIVGQLRGVAAVTGQDLTSETLLRVGAIDWLVLPNINRTDRNDFYAVALD